MDNKIVIKFEIACLCIAGIVGAFWIFDPEGNYEPIFAFCLFVPICIETYRRLSKKNPSKTKSIKPVLPSTVRDKKESFKPIIESYILNDQIPESGGWGLSQSLAFENITGLKQTEIEIREGGIVSTFIALRALNTIGHKLSAATNPAKSAIAYLTKRQDYNGGFGRFVLSRSGEEIHPSFRHTALSIMGLLEADGPPSSIQKGVQYLKTLSVHDIEKDSSPSIAAAIILWCLQRLSSINWVEKYMGTDDVEWFNGICKDLEPQLIAVLISQSKDSNNKYSPFWPPYGGHDKMIFDTALTTIDFASSCEAVPTEQLIPILESISNHKVGNGLPYEMNGNIPDIGISMYFGAVCYRPSIYNALIKDQNGCLILDFANQCIEFSVKYFGDNRNMKFTYIDTIGNASSIYT